MIPIPKQVALMPDTVTEKKQLPTLTKVGKIAVFIGVSIVFAIGIFFIAETIFRIKLLGYQKAIQSYAHPVQQPSVLGTSDWYISDPDLNYRFNTSLPEINQYSMFEKNVTVPKPTGVIRIVILGDSLPFRGYPSLIDMVKEKYVNQSNVEILNASTPGYTTYQEMIFLEKYLLALEPDVVILAYCLNDNYTFLHRFDKDANMLWTDEAKNSLQITSYFDALISKSYFLTSLKLDTMKNNTKVKEYKYPWEGSVDFNIAWKDYSWIDFSSRLKRMQSVLQVHNSKLYVVIFPLELQLDEALLKENYELVTKPQREVLLYCDQYQIPCLDLFNDFYKNNHEGKRLYVDGLHLSKIGQTISLDAISSFLSKEYFSTKGQ
jgi:hypothetical protein